MAPALLCQKKTASKARYCLLLAGSLWHKDRWLPCTESCPYAIKNQHRARNTPRALDARAVSLWHKRADASNSSDLILDIEVDQSVCERGLIRSDLVNLTLNTLNILITLTSLRTLPALPMTRVSCNNFSLSSGSGFWYCFKWKY